MRPRPGKREEEEEGGSEGGGKRGARGGWGVEMAGTERGRGADRDSGRFKGKVRSRHRLRQSVSGADNLCLVQTQIAVAYKYT